MAMRDHAAICVEDVMNDSGEADLMSVKKQRSSSKTMAVWTEIASPSRRRLNGQVVEAGDRLQAG